MRKKAQERKRTMFPSSSLSNSSSSSSNSRPVDSMPVVETKERSFYDTGGLDNNMMLAAPRGKKTNQEEEQKGNFMDEIWKDLPFSEDDPIKPVCDGGYSEEGCNFSSQTLVSPLWDYRPDSLWMMDEEEIKMFLPTNDQFFPLYGHDHNQSSYLTG